MSTSKYAHIDKLSPKEKRQWMQEDWILGKISTDEMFKRFEQIVLNAIKDEL